MPQSPKLKSKLTPKSERQPAAAPMVTIPAPVIGNPAAVDALTPPPVRPETPPGTRVRVAIVGTVGLPSRYGGFETLAQYLVEYLGDEFEFTVYCSGPTGSIRRDCIRSE